MSTLYEEIKAVIDPKLCNEQIAQYWLERLEKGDLTRDDGNVSHFCCYFLPYNPATHEVFIVHHKKSGLWLFPGGHIDKGEPLMKTLNREIEEELGVKNRIKEEIKPFLLTITPIENRVQPCKEHMDIWYRFPTDGSEFNVDPTEFHATRWTSIKGARELMTDPPNLEALNRMEEFFSS
jgi:8-oxo-dGTP pyrophosphatase MutT (NUDIX family)